MSLSMYLTAVPTSNKPIAIWDFEAPVCMNLSLQVKYMLDVSKKPLVFQEISQKVPEEYPNFTWISPLSTSLTTSIK